MRLIGTADELIDFNVFQSACLNVMVFSRIIHSC